MILLQAVTFIHLLKTKKYYYEKTSKITKGR